MAGRELYVCVAVANTIHSSVWKIWVQGDELYAAQVAMNPVIRTHIVHSSGACRLANAEGSVIDLDRDSGSDPQVLSQWAIEALRASAWRRCFGIMVPSVFVPVRFCIDEILPPGRIDRISRVEPAPLGRATFVECLEPAVP